MTSVDEVMAVLRGYRWPLADEMKLQEAIERKFEEAGLDFRREHRLGPRDRIDFMIGNIGIEVKIKSGLSALYRQIKRYAEHEEVHQIILVTNVQTAFPPEVEGKPVYYLNLAKIL